jgi:hypothetical protein
VRGAITVKRAPHRIRAVAASALIFAAGASMTADSSFSGNVFGTGNANSVVFQSGSTYTHKSGANPFGLAAPASVVVFQTGSLYSFQMNGSPTFSNRTYANFEMAGGVTCNYTSTLGSAWTVDRLEIKSGCVLGFATSASTTAPFNFKGDVIVDGQLTFGTNDHFNINLNGTTVQHVSGASGVTFPATLTSVTVNNASGVQLGSNAAVSCPLTFTAGSITTGSNTLTAGGTVTGAGAGRYVIGRLARVVGTGAQAPMFDIGDATSYTPVTLSYANVTTGGSVTASTTGDTYPDLGSSALSASKYVKRYWSLANNGVVGSCSATFNFLAGDLQGGANTDSLRVGKYASSVWSYPTVGTRTSTSTQATDLASYGDFVLAEQASAPLTSTSTSLTSTVNPVASGNSLGLVATVSPSAATGTVVYYDGADSIGVATLNAGTATLTLSTLPVGIRTLHAAYRGDATYSGSVSADYSQTVRPTSPQTYTWNGATSDWTIATNWTPARTLPWNSDILQFPIGGTVQNVPTQTIGQLVLSSGATLTLKAGAANNTLTIAGGSGTDLVVPAGCSLTTTFTYAVLFTLSSGVTGSIGGTLAVAAGIENYGTLQIDNGGTFLILGGGYINDAGPVYASGSLLKYSINGHYGRWMEWSSASGAGHPANVQLSTNTVLDLNNFSNAGRACAGSLTIDAGAKLAMNDPIGAINYPLTVGGDLNLNGTLELSGLSGGVLYVGGNWNRTGTFTPNGRSVTFMGSAAQSLTGTTTFDALALENAAGLTLNNDVTVTGDLTLTAGRITTGANRIALGSGNVIGPTATRYVNGNFAWTGIGTGPQVRTFPIGDATSYAPVMLAFDNVTTTGDLTAHTVAGPHPSLGASALNSTAMVTCQ